MANNDTARETRTTIQWIRDADRLLATRLRTWAPALAKQTAWTGAYATHTAAQTVAASANPHD